MMKDIINIGLCGSTGKMGASVKKLIHNIDQYNLAYQYNSKSNLVELDIMCKKSDVVIDFSLPLLLDNLLQYAINYQTKLVICTTGLSVKQHQAIEDASKVIPILYAANTSIGANLIARLVSKMVKILHEYDISITDIHHKHKKDAPSGTAMMIRDAIGKDVDMHSIRAGGIFGEHTIMFASDSEVIKIQHQALNRDVFAQGALTAAKWIMEKDHGMFSMQDVIESR